MLNKANTLSRQNNIAVLAEDYSLNLSMMKEIVLCLGLTPQSFGRAEDAMAFVMKNRTKVRLLLTDFCMPGSISGAEMAMVVACRFPEIPTIVTSELIDRVLELGPNVVFAPKHWPLDKMAETVERMVSAPQAIVNQPFARPSAARADVSAPRPVHR